MQFARGFVLIRESLPSSLATSYNLFERMYEASYLSSQNNKNTKDAELRKSNIHTLFLALRNRSDINLSVMAAVAEKLATLSILGFLDDSDNHTPWKNSNLIIKSNT